MVKKWQWGVFFHLLCLLCFCQAEDSPHASKSWYSSEMLLQMGKFQHCGQIIVTHYREHMTRPYCEKPQTLHGLYMKDEMFVFFGGGMHCKHDCDDGLYFLTILLITAPPHIPEPCCAAGSWKRDQHTLSY